MSKINLISMKELLNTNIGEPDWVVDELLPIGGTSMLCAKAKAGKSTLARNLTLAVAQGKAFLGKTTKQGGVIYLAMEESLIETKKHYQDLGATETDQIFVCTDMLPRNPIELIVRITNELNPSLIIVDTLFRCIRVNDSNDYAQVTNGLDPYIHLARDLKTHIMFLHHARKGDTMGTESILGSSAILASIDTAIIMNENSLGIRTIETKQRYGKNMSRCGLVFDEIKREYNLGDIISSSIDTENRIKGEIIDLLLGSEEQSLSRDEILERITGKKENVLKVLQRLCEEEEPVLTRKGDGVRGSPYIYKICS